MKNFEADFKEWVRKNYCKELNETDRDFFSDVFEDVHPFSMKWGVYLEFFDSVGVFLSITSIINDESERVFQAYLDYEHIESTNTRQEAQKEAIKKAIEIYESK